MQILIKRALHRYLVPLYGLIVFGFVSRVFIDPWLDIAIKRPEWRISYDVIYYPSFTVIFLLCMWNTDIPNTRRIVFWGAAIGYACGLAAYIFMHFALPDGAERLSNTLRMHVFPLNYIGLLGAGLLTGGIVPGLLAGICVAVLKRLEGRVAGN